MFEKMPYFPKKALKMPGWKPFHTDDTQLSRFQGPPDLPGEGGGEGGGDGGRPQRRGETRGSSSCGGHPRFGGRKEEGGR